MLYLDLMMKYLTRPVFDGATYAALDSVSLDARRLHKRAFAWVYPWFNELLAPYGLELVRVADSFQGLPKPDLQRYPKHAGDHHWTARQLRIPLEEVKANFARYGLLDN